MEAKQQQFAAITAEITSKIFRLSNKSQQARVDDLAIIEQLFSDAKAKLDELDDLVKSSNPTEKEAQASHLVGFRKELTKLRNDFKTAKTRKLESVDDLVRIDLDPGGDSANLLDDTLSLSTPTRQLGAKMLNLASQRKASGRDVRRNLEGNRRTRILTVVLRRAKQSKIVLYLTISISVLVIFVFLYSHVLQDSGGPIS